ncbi:hypothetical protein EJ06DRAFT_505207 [Trichodelitschia bisporula]|uniref:Rab-GAP TBC domain-containing protein n=1 Tax=Trichodelitschia bisporula TaxID=703511 RepID=A0A6G1I6P0_9PEZI|nr:hypothetical protein EJ06DRAFT_505207 [Trichodelitschia bisporula]
MEAVTDVSPLDTECASTPRKHAEGGHLATDSLVTISLSESDSTRPQTLSADGVKSERATTSSEAQSMDDASKTDSFEFPDSSSPNEDDAEDTSNESQGQAADSPASLSGRSRSGSTDSNHSIQVDWEKLDKTEQREDAGSESDEQTTLLLARLEQENNAIATDPKSALKSRLRTQSRPPSIQQLRKLVQEQGARSVRFSMLPAAAPMTELDFWAALVRDYSQTAQRLPTVTSTKIRGGIPAPLRGVVWVSMAGARDRFIEEQYEKLCGESSPYENIINKDIGRSFPGVEMFRDPAGEGQKMLGRVLKCYSLYDDKIGYCQGLGFLVGPLLMNMGEKQAFCVLVRLMEDYDLRSCFLPDLSGLHLRIYQFQKLLHQHVPKLAAHLDSLGVEGAYLSQWFLSFFAVTCPLPMLFRIYDVIFAEGASETIMRVALSIMKRNEKKLIGFTEFEDAMQLLLSRALWDPYGLNATSADEFVDDFCGFTSVVTRDSLQALEASFREVQTGDSPGGRMSFFPDVQSAASRFLGRLWISSHTPSKSTTASLTPALVAPPRPDSVLLRTPSKQSLATLNSINSIEGTSDGSGSTLSTAVTEASIMSRESCADLASLKSIKSPTDPSRLTTSSRDKGLHGQIEDLLTALSETQREHAVSAAQLEREREERAEDRLLIRSLMQQLKKEVALRPAKFTHKRATSELPIPRDGQNSSTRYVSESAQSLIEAVDSRFSAKHTDRQSSLYETKAQLRMSVDALKEQLRNEASKNRELTRQLSEKDLEADGIRDELQKARARIKDGYVEKQRLEQTVLDLRQVTRQNSGLSRSPSRSGSDISLPDSAFTPSRSDTLETDASSTTGLREFKLISAIRPKRATQVFNKRTSSLVTQPVLSTEKNAPPSEESLLLELVNAKTAEAVARQELEELRARFEALRKMLNITSPLPSPLATDEPINYTKTPITKTPESTKTATPSSGGWGPPSGFFGWGKRSASTANVPTITAEHSK